MFSGNRSLAHPLDTLLQAVLRLQDEADLEFLFGGGLGKRKIEATIEREYPRNIRSLPYQSLETLHYSFAAVDVHVGSVGNEMGRGLTPLQDLWRNGGGASHPAVWPEPLPCDRYYRGT